MSIEKADPKDNARSPSPVASWRPADAGGQASVRELMVELALVEYELRTSVPEGVLPRVLIERRRSVVAALRSRQVPVTAPKPRRAPSTLPSLRTTGTTAAAQPMGELYDEYCAALLERICHLERALEGRTVIGQAQGILMERHKLTAEQAFNRLRTRSQHVNRKLREVAQALATTGDESAVGHRPALPQSAPAQGTAHGGVRWPGGPPASQTPRGARPNRRASG